MTSEFIRSMALRLNGLFACPRAIPNITSQTTCTVVTAHLGPQKLGVRASG